MESLDRTYRVFASSISPMTSLFQDGLSLVVRVCIRNGMTMAGAIRFGNHLTLVHGAVKIDTGEVEGHLSHC